MECSTISANKKNLFQNSLSELTEYYFKNYGISIKNVP